MNVLCGIFYILVVLVQVTLFTVLASIVFDHSNTSIGYWASLAVNGFCIAYLMNVHSEFFKD